MKIYHRCPVCPTERSRSGREIRNNLNCVEQNYQGYDVDIYECLQCKRTFQIHYEVSQVWELDESWELVRQFDRNGNLVPQIQEVAPDA
jgi:uncharacterized protein with PIN domain